MVTRVTFSALGPNIQIGVVPPVSVERLMQRENFYFQNKNMEKLLPIIKGIVD